jgi:tight adherence protein C
MVCVYDRTTKMTLLPIIASMLMASSVLLIFLGFTVRSTTAVRQRIELYNGVSMAVALDEPEAREPFAERVLKPAMRQMNRLLGVVLPNKRLGKLRLRLQLAGHPGRLTAADFVGIKGWVTVLLALLAAGYVYIAHINLSLLTVLAIGAFIACGYMAPDFWLSRRITRRRRELSNALPDALDMLTIAIEAGLSFDQGIGEIVTRWKHELSDEFRLVLYEIGLGKSRREALEHLSERTDVADLLAFVTAVNHAEELGTSLSQTLNVQAQEMRVRRRQRAQEAANKLPVKMMFPMVFLIFPALFAVILGPGIPRLFESLGVHVGG